MKILYISPNSESNLTNYHLNRTLGHADYMCDLALHGLRELYGNDVVDYPGCWHLYSDEVKQRFFNTNRLWGKGFSLNNSFDEYDSIDRSDINQKIKTKYFDLIVYGSIRRSSLFIEDVIKYNNKFIFIDGEDDRVIDERYSSKSLYFKRELITETKNIKPINFSIPKHKIIKEANRKPKNLLSPLIPGKLETYIYKDEGSYYKMYQDSVFGLTYRKGGWDCLRHYEILMNGCIPLFLDLDKCPTKTLEKIPKDLLIEILEKYGWILSQYNPFFIYKRKFLDLRRVLLFLISSIKSKHNVDDFINNNAEIFEIKKELLDYTRNNLTTEHIAKEIIEEVKLS